MRAYPTRRVFMWLAAQPGTMLFADGAGRLFMPLAHVPALDGVAHELARTPPDTGTRIANPAAGAGGRSWSAGLRLDDALVLAGGGGADVVSAARAVLRSTAPRLADPVQVCWVARPAASRGSLPEERVPGLLDGAHVPLYRVPPAYRPRLGSPWAPGRWAAYLGGGGDGGIPTRIMTSTWASEAARGGADAEPACGLCVWEPVPGGA